ncbi:hypothetical protein V5F59_14530 [Xanthobacter autotrophicus DSM 431]|uniref:hypothetical protein n=1 Tax=Xanthobacter nonsaccharivorans TaxID=3119912 RepID=UPI00372ACFA5
MTARIRKKDDRNEENDLRDLDAVPVMPPNPSAAVIRSMTGKVRARINIKASFPSTADPLDIPGITSSTHRSMTAIY